MFDPQEVAEAAARAAAERLKAKRAVRLDRKEGRDILVGNISEAEAALEAYDKETLEQLEYFPRLQAHKEKHKAALKEYDDAMVAGSKILKGEDTDPELEDEAWAAQNRIMSAFTNLGEFTEEDECYM